MERRAGLFRETNLRRIIYFYTVVENSFFLPQLQIKKMGPFSPPDIISNCLFCNIGNISKKTAGRGKYFLVENFFYVAWKGRQEETSVILFAKSPTPSSRLSCLATLDFFTVSRVHYWSRKYFHTTECPLRIFFSLKSIYSVHELHRCDQERSRGISRPEFWESMQKTKGPSRDASGSSLMWRIGFLKKTKIHSNHPYFSSNPSVHTSIKRMDTSMYFFLLCFAAPQKNELKNSFSSIFLGQLWIYSLWKSSRY